MMFYNGQPVVCINGNFDKVSQLYPGLTWPVQGQKYIVRCYVPGIKSPNFPAILLQEITNRDVTYMCGTVREAGFWEQRFAPVTKDQIKSIIEEAQKMGPWTGGVHWKEKESEDA